MFLSPTDFLDYFKSINCPNSVFFQPEEDVLFFNEKGELNGMFSELKV